MNSKNIMIAVLIFGFAMTAFAQGRGGSGGGQRGSGQGGHGNSGTQGQGAGVQTGQQQGQQNRQRIHATEQQRTQAEDCTRAADQVRSRIREMSRLKTGQSISAGQAKQWREQLREEMQAMNREQQQLTSSLSETQKTEAKQTTQDMKISSDRLDALADALDVELALESPDPIEVREKARELETAMNKYREVQRNFNSEIGVD